ncbi:MAG: ribosome silencing factor [Candidatus Margulisiibacteriota bacterium]
MKLKAKPGRTKALSSNAIASLIAKAAQDKQALDLEIIDIRKTSSVCNYMVLASGNSSPHVQALRDGIDEALSKAGIKDGKWQGKRDSNWMVLDLIGVVAHVMGRQEREKYALEKLWEKSAFTYHV